MDRIGRRVAVAVILLLTSASAHAGDAEAVARRGGFLLGQALRCGVAEARLEPSARLVHDLVKALATSKVEQRDAGRSFAGSVVASVKPAADKPLPSCTQVRRKLALLERHHASKPTPAANLPSTSFRYAVL